MGEGGQLLVPHRLPTRRWKRISVVCLGFPPPGNGVPYPRDGGEGSYAEKHRELRCYGKEQDANAPVACFNCGSTERLHSVIGGLPKQGLRHRSAQTLTENLHSNSQVTGRDSWSPSTAVPAHPAALERTHRSTSILASLLPGEQVTDNNVPAGSGRNTLPWCLLHVLFTSSSGGLLIQISDAAKHCAR